MSYNINGTTIRLTRGDSFAAEVGIYYADGSAYEPASTDAIRFALKHPEMTPGNKDYRQAAPILIKQIPYDTLLLELAPEDTEDLDFGQYVYDIELTKADGTVDTFITASPFILTPEVH